MKKIILPFTILFITLNLNAQYLMTGVPGVQQDTLQSTVNGENYYLQLTLPFPFDPVNNKYSVLYYLDAFSSTAGLNELAKSKMFSRDFDPFIMVGISYNTNPMVYGNLRKRDYMPPVNAEDTEHGGDKFLEFIKSELIPYMESNYGADPNDRGLMGFSLGGLFTIWTIKQEPNLFNKLAILSPSLMYGGNDFILENPDFLENINDIENLNVFLSYGSLEGYDFVSLGDKLHNIFKLNKNIQIEKVIFKDEDHGSVWNAASSRALHSLYQDPFKASVKRVDNLYYSKEYKKALEAYQLVFEKFPDRIDDGNKYDLACLFALTGDSDSAFEYLNKLDIVYRDWPEKMNRDTDLSSLHKDKRWDSLLESLKRE